MSSYMLLVLLLLPFIQGDDFLEEEEGSSADDSVDECWTDCHPDDRFSDSADCSQCAQPGEVSTWQGERDLDLSLDCLARPLTFSFSLSKFMELSEPWLDSSWHLEVTTEEVKEGLKKTVAEGEVGEMEETVKEIEDVCLGEVLRACLTLSKEDDEVSFCQECNGTKICEAEEGSFDVTLNSTLSKFDLEEEEEDTLFLLPPVDYLGSEEEEYDEAEDSEQEDEGVEEDDDFADDKHETSEEAEETVLRGGSPLEETLDPMILLVPMEYLDYTEEVENGEDEGGNDKDAQIAESCDESERGCCPGSKMPAHGANGFGCCAESTWGCCPDFLSPSPAPYIQGCDCKSSPFGCCPDSLTPASGPSQEGCGCHTSPNGCCPDQQTQAPDEGPSGCSCQTQSFGCCPDGVTPAQGANLEGCDLCSHLQYGCCSDGFTPAAGPAEEGCGCASSTEGCCPLGGGSPKGPLYAGCPNLPGHSCHLPANNDSCSDFEVKWHYDMSYGGCARFWYGGCQPAGNLFESEEMCKEQCVHPRGDLVCLLPMVIGPCEGEYNEWYHDHTSKTCRKFRYSGCLGNANRFPTEAACQETCQPRKEQPLCQKPKAEGGCLENHPRWFFNKESGVCEQFQFSGCGGNNNRFMSERECESACRHEAKAVKSLKTCALFPDPGACSPSVDGRGNQTLARWTYHPYNRRCIPFYYTGCGGNDNNFLTRAACEEVCPTTFPPIVDLEEDPVLLEKGRTGVIKVRVRGNPPPNVSWSYGGWQVGQGGQLQVREDHSLVIAQVRPSSAGNYTITAENGIGTAVAKIVRVVVWPLPVSVKLSGERKVELNSELDLTCKASGYPTPEISWWREEYRHPPRRLREDGRVSLLSVSVTKTEVEGRLLIRGLTERDAATYRCKAQSHRGEESSQAIRVRVRWNAEQRCRDKVSYSSDCQYARRYPAICKQTYYRTMCCRTCAEVSKP